MTRAAVFLAMGFLALLGISHLGAESDDRTFCVERPISFDPLFKPSGCFTYKQVGGGVVVIGRALLDSQFLANGGTIEAQVNGAPCGSTTAGVDGLFMLPIAGGESQAGCASAGQRVDFVIDGVVADQSLDWPSEPGPNPRFLSLSSVTEAIWYWFERATTPTARVGTVVEAYTKGTLCGATTIGGEGQAFGVHIRSNLRGFMRLVVSPANMTCGQPGSLVEFRVGGLRAETVAPWDPGVHRLNVLVQGDANCDFLVDSRDALIVLQVGARLAASVPCHGDVDHDDDIDVFDARHVLEFAGGITDELPWLVS